MLSWSMEMEFACVSVPEEIDFPLATFSSLKEIIGDVLGGGKRLGLVGVWDISEPIMQRIRQAVDGIEIVDGAGILQRQRIIKSAAEVACLRAMRSILSPDFTV